jgi:hypothetical protein
VDRNGNGVSDKGEVLPAREAGIVRIGVRAMRGSDGVLMGARGVEFANGKVVPTFDWVAKAVQGKSGK